jgi:hypothetical protein
LWDTSDKQRVQGLICDAAAQIGAKLRGCLRLTDAGAFRRLLEDGAGRTSLLSTGQCS